MKLSPPYVPLNVYIYSLHVCYFAMLEPTQDYQPERDINDIFDDIILTEERLVEKSYKEGFADGCQQGNADGYCLGFAQGLQLGEELAEIYGLAIALQQQPKHTDKVKRCLEQLKSLIEKFPKENDPEADIIGALEQIRNLNKRFRLLIGSKSGNSDSQSKETKDLSF